MCVYYRILNKSRVMEIVCFEFQMFQIVWQEFGDVQLFIRIGIIIYFWQKRIKRKYFLFVQYGFQVERCFWNFWGFVICQWLLGRIDVFGYYYLFIRIQWSWKFCKVLYYFEEVGWKYYLLNSVCFFIFSRVLFFDQEVVEIQ